MIQRAALQRLEQWKLSGEHKPMIIRGARQVGKTTLINQFAIGFDNYLYLNLDRNRDLGLFVDDEIPSLIDRIHIHCRKRKNNGQTLLFIDEIQNSPNAVSLLRYFKEEAPWLYIVAAGSLLETLIDTQVSFPVGRVEYMALRPCSFVEFLNGIGEEYDAEIVRTLHADAIHDRLMNHFLNYIIVGGMPEAIVKYAEHRVMPNYRRKPKLLWLDTGLVNYYAGVRSEIFNGYDIMSVWMGRIAEHIVAQELIAENFEFGVRRNYWLREKVDASAEIDFVYQYGNIVIPIEVKSGTNSKLRSLHWFMDRAPHDIAVRVWTGRYSIDIVTTPSGKSFRLINLPFYYVGQLNNILASLL